MANENMNAILEARLTAALAAEARITALAIQIGETVVDLRNQLTGAQLAHMRVYESPPHRRSTDVRRDAGPLTFDAADRVQPAAWPPAEKKHFEPGEQLP